MTDIAFDTRPRPLSGLRGIAAMLNELHDGDAPMTPDERLSLCLEIIAGTAVQARLAMREGGDATWHRRRAVALIVEKQLEV